MAMIKLLAQAEAQPSVDKARLLAINVEPANKMMNIQIAKGYEQAGQFVIKAVSNHAWSCF